jgi:tryptophan-rich sensory protein
MSIKPIKLKSLIFWVGTALLAGGIGALLGGNTEKYANMAKPPLSPPAIVFPIVWSVLYVLIGIGAYIINREKAPLSPIALKFYWAQLILNALWPLIFWRLEAVTLAAFWLGLILVLTAILTYLAYKINKNTLWFFLPYLIWLCFALYLNIGFAILN